MNISLEEYTDLLKKYEDLRQEKIKILNKYYVEKDDLKQEIERLNKCIDEALEIIIKDWNDKCTIPIHAVVDTGGDIRIKLYYQLFFKGIDKE